MKNPVRTLLRALPVFALAAATAARSQTNPPTPDPGAAPAASQANPWSAFTSMSYAKMEEWLIRAAEKMPEDAYAGKPTEAVRSFGQIVGHVADAQYLFCSEALGRTNPAPRIEKTRTTKADLVAALKDAFAYCDPAYAALTDASGSEMVKAHWGEMPRGSVLTANVLHCTEHYGNVITYLRLKGIVPPSSEPGGMTPPQRKK